MKLTSIITQEIQARRKIRCNCRRHRWFGMPEMSLLNQQNALESSRYMKRQDQVWISSEDLSNDPGLIQESQKEFFDVPVLNELSKDENQIPSGRRDFLKYLGFGLGAATVAAACDTPVRKALPYLTKPDAIVPGVATYYSSTFVKGADFCPVIIKTREGRPIKIEGNTMSPLSNGGTSARAQASVLDLYDVSRFKGPMMKNDSGELEATTWEDLDKTLSQQITNAARLES